MRAWLFIPVAIGFLCSLACYGEAAVRKGQIPSPNAATTRATPFNVDECTTLGGKVTSASICTSGQACHTTDQNGKAHYVCISATKK